MRIIERKSGLLPLLALAACYTTTLHAAEHEHRHHGAHEHGAGQLNIAIEQGELHIELQSPAMNIVGFEHQPRNAQQREALRHAVALLRAGDKLFITSAEAGCHLQQAQLESDLLEGQAEHADHDEGNDHDEEPSHEGHTDFVASYHFSCNRPQALHGITVRVFAEFPATEELELQLLHEGGVSTRELSATTPYIEL